MSRVKTGFVARRRHKRVLKQATGFRGRRKNTFRAASRAVIKSGQYAYRDRRVAKRDYRRLWIQRINAAARAHGLTYSVLMGLLRKQDIVLDRKALATLAFEDEAAFSRVVEAARL